MSAWDAGIEFVRGGGTLDSLGEEIERRGLNAADCQAFTLGFLEGIGTKIAPGSREVMDDACARFARSRRRN